MLYVYVQVELSGIRTIASLCHGRPDILFRAMQGRNFSLLPRVGIKWRVRDWFYRQRKRVK